jgi:hypothetical protein
MRGSNLGRSSENTKSEKFGVDIKGFMIRKSVKIPILGQPVGDRPQIFLTKIALSGILTFVG